MTPTVETDPGTLLRENATLRAMVAELAQQIDLLKNDKATLEQRLQYFLNRTFGRSSERIDPSQLVLFGVGGEVTPAPAPLTEEITYTRKVSGGGHARTAFGDHLPRRVIPLDPPEAERVCGCCGKSLVRFREEFTERGDLIPAKIVVNHYVRGVWACKDGCEAPRMADLPPAVIDKGKWEVSAYAHLIVAKYGDHLPLHRQVGIFKRYGIEFPKSTMCDMEKRAAELALPIWNRMREEILESRVILADESPLTFMRDGPSAPGKGSKTGYAWVYRAREKIAFVFTTSRSRAGPKAFLDRWKGTLLTDDYDGYHEVSVTNGIREARCIVHGRRRMREAHKAGEKDRAGWALFWIRRLFRIERAIDRRLEGRGRTLEDPLAFRREVRQRLSRRVMERLKRKLLEWKDDPRILPKGPLGKAVRYFVRTDEQWAKFAVFLDDPEVPLHNNASENAIRPIALGRKNWMVAGSAKGAEASMRLASLVASCRAIDVNPEEYLSDVLRSLDVETRPENLTPWAWKARQAPTNTPPSPPPAAS